MTDGLVVLLSWIEFAALIALLLFLVLRER